MNVLVEGFFDFESFRIAWTLLKLRWSVGVADKWWLTKKNDEKFQENVANGYGLNARMMEVREGWKTWEVRVSEEVENNKLTGRG